MGNTIRCLRHHNDTQVEYNCCLNDTRRGGGIQTFPPLEMFLLIHHRHLQHEKKTLFFKTWSSYSLMESSRHMKRTERQLHNRMATLHQKLSNFESSEMRLLRNVQELQEKNEEFSKKGTENNANVVCTICFDNVDKSECVSCNACCTHYHCLSCLDRLCDSMRKDVSNSPRDFQFICQSAGTECSGTLKVCAIAKSENGIKLLNEWQHKRSIQTALATLEEQSLDDAKLHLSYIREDGTFSAFACPKCGFGPIEHRFCSDLQEFHDRCVNICYSVFFFLSSSSALVKN